MKKIKITSCFRFKGEAFGVTKKAVNMADDAAGFAIANGLGVDPAAEAEAKAKEKAVAEPEANKAHNGAPANK